MFNVLKPKGIEIDTKFKVPKELEETEMTKKPTIDLNLSDRLNQFLGILKNVIIENIQYIIPFWVWIVLIILISLVIILQV